MYENVLGILKSLSGAHVGRVMRNVSLTFFWWRMVRTGLLIEGISLWAHNFCETRDPECGNATRACSNDIFLYRKHPIPFKTEWRNTTPYRSSRLKVHETHLLISYQHLFEKKQDFTAVSDHSVRAVYEVLTNYSILYCSWVMAGFKMLFSNTTRLSLVCLATLSAIWKRLFHSYSHTHKSL